MTRDFEAEHGVLLAALDGPERRTKLRALHEAWARAILEVDAAAPLVTTVQRTVGNGVFVSRADAAAQQLNEAVRWQWERGAVDDRASMNELRTLQLARAWLLVANPLTVAEARALATEVSRDSRASDEVTNGAKQLLAQLNRLRPEDAN